MARRALLVGIDQYPDPRNNLNSCVADTLAFRNQVLIAAYNFDAADIVMLHNNDATLNNVRSGLDKLFKGASAGDDLVYFESSHGYRYPEADTMVEVLCLYDAFLEDTELVQRTQSLPSDVLTVVLDACHSGGMDKVYFPPGGTAVARAKVFAPDPLQAQANAQLLQQVSKFKFFGRATTGDTGAVAKQFFALGPSRESLPATKDIAAGQVELNGVLFAACAADQTAAAGSPATANLSAFTFSLIDQLDTKISLKTLSDKVAARLEQLNMRQTPEADWPVAHPELAAETFINMKPVASGSANGSQPEPVTPISGSGGVPAGFDPVAWRNVFGLVPA